MATAVALHAVSSLKDPKKAFFWGKIALAIFCPPAAVAVELHSFDKVSLTLMGVATLLWLFGWLPGVMFALFIIVSSTGKNRVLSWFKGLMPGSAAAAPPTTDVEAGGAKSSWFSFGGSKASGSGAPAAAAPAVPVASPTPAPASATTHAVVAPASAAAPVGGGWFGGGK